MHDPEKSDLGIRAGKPTNKAGQPAAEPVEQRPGTKGNEGQQSTLRTQSREGVTHALDRVRQAARQRKKEKFTALLHHITVDLLRKAFQALKRKAAPGEWIVRLHLTLRRPLGVEKFWSVRPPDVGSFLS